MCLMQTGVNKPTNRGSAIAEHLLNNSECANNYSDSNFFQLLVKHVVNIILMF